MTPLLNWLTVLLLAGSLWLRSPLLFLLAVLLALTAGVTALWDRYALAAVSYVRRLGTARLFVGEETDLWVEIVNAKPLPLAWLRVDDEFPEDVELLRGKLHYSYKPARRILANLLSLSFYERVRKQYRVRARQRGVFEFGPTELRSGDVFGFKSRLETLPNTDRLIVYPRVVPVVTPSLPTARPFGDVKSLCRVAEDPLRVVGVRPYAPGDSLRFVHWKATARRRELQSKVFEPGATPSSAIFLDLRTTTDYPGMVPDYVEYAITAAASVARFLLDGREAVGLYVNGARRTDINLVRLPPSRRPAQWLEILETFAWLSSLAYVPMDRCLRAEMSSLPFGTTVIAISAAVTEDLLAALWDVKRAGHPSALLAIGEKPPPDVPDDLRLFWIGGHESYERLQELDLQPWPSGAA